MDTTVENRRALEAAGYTFEISASNVKVFFRGALIAEASTDAAYSTYGGLLRWAIAVVAAYKQEHSAE